MTNKRPKRAPTRSKTAKAKAPVRAGAKRPTTKRAQPRAVERSAAAIAPAPALSSAPARAIRRAIFIDVENTSSEESLAEVLEGLKIDHGSQRTELTAVGNWRTVGQRMGRHLASLGAQLVHSAPASGVRDWSDLWIAVAAGCWLGQSAPGDVLEIVSNDRAFDAVGDAAAARGVIYRRLQHRRGAAVTAEVSEPKPAARRSRGGRRRRGRPRSEHPAVAAATTPARPPSAARAASHAEVEPHGATREQMLMVIERLSGGDAARWVNLDILEKALKAEGFARPPGSPRLVTRLRMLKEVEIDSHGRVRMAPGAQHPAPEPAQDDGEPAKPTLPAGKAAAPKRRRRRRSKASSAAGDPEIAPVEAQATQE